MSYHLNARIVSRGKGHSMIAKAAYNARASIMEERTGELKDYTRHKDRPMASFVFASNDNLRDPEKLWQFYDRQETRSNAQMGVSFIAALPHQLTDEQRAYIVKDFAREQFMRKGAAVQADIHRPDSHGDERNFHVHMLASMRPVEGGTLGKGKVFTWEDKEKNLVTWRQKWAERGARELEKAGFKTEAERWRYGYLTNEQQLAKALERGDTEWAEKKAQEATKHLGPTASEIERKGQASDRGDLNRMAEGKTREQQERKAAIDKLEAAISQEKERLSNPPATAEDARERMREDRQLYGAGLRVATRLEKALPADRTNWSERMFQAIARGAKGLFDSIAQKALRLAGMGPDRRQRQQPTAHDRRWRERARQQADKDRGRDI